MQVLFSGTYVVNRPVVDVRGDDYARQARQEVMDNKALRAAIKDLPDDIRLSHTLADNTYYEDEPEGVRSYIVADGEDKIVIEKRDRDGNFYPLNPDRQSGEYNAEGRYEGVYDGFRQTAKPKRDGQVLKTAWFRTPVSDVGPELQDSRIKGFIRKQLVELLPARPEESITDLLNRAVKQAQHLVERDRTRTELHSEV